MASYNLAKAADRERSKADAQAELAALDGGWWPRDANDQHRWGTNDRTRIRAFLESSLAYLVSVGERIQAGDPDLAGWEPDAGTKAPNASESFLWPSWPVPQPPRLGLDPEPNPILPGRQGR